MPPIFTPAAAIVNKSVNDHPGTRFAAAYEKVSRHHDPAVRKAAAQLCLVLDKPFQKSTDRERSAESYEKAFDALPAAVLDYPDFSKVGNPYAGPFDFGNVVRDAGGGVFVVDVEALMLALRRSGR
jgi:hypothetical protein